jgi:hypothetical protein
MLAVFAVHLPAHHKQHLKHHRCTTLRCDRLWSRHHARKPGVITTFDLCVANRENGEPGVDTYSTINWHAKNDYYGAYSFLHETWKAAGGLRFAPNANKATPEQQSIVFNHWSSVDPGAWPNTIPPCE